MGKFANMSVLVLTIMATVITVSSDTALGTEPPTIDLSQGEKLQTELSILLEKFDKTADVSHLTLALHHLGTYKAYIHGLDKTNKEQHFEHCLATTIAILESIAKVADPNFDPKDAPEINIAPPGGRHKSGIDPESIEDQNIRKQYKELIKKNQEKIEYITIQSRLYEVAQRAKRFLLIACVEYIGIKSGKGDLSPKVRELLLKE